MVVIKPILLILFMPFFPLETRSAGLVYFLFALFSGVSLGILNILDFENYWKLFKRFCGPFNIWLIPRGVRVLKFVLTRK